MSTDSPAEPSPPPGGEGAQPPRRDQPLSRMLTSRYAGILALVGLVVGAFILPPVGLGASTCTMYNMTGIPCPGCGLTRSVTSTLHGSFLAAFQYNPFGYVFAVGFLLLTPMTFLPLPLRERIQRWLGRFERLLLVLLISFIVLFVAHGLIRGVLIKMDREPYQWWNRSNVPPAFQHLTEEE